jgi:hypothetical protein
MIAQCLLRNFRKKKKWEYDQMKFLDSQGHTLRREVKHAIVATLNGIAPGDSVWLRKTPDQFILTTFVRRYTVWEDIGHFVTHTDGQQQFTSYCLDSYNNCQTADFFVLLPVSLLFKDHWIQGPELEDLYQSLFDPIQVHETRRHWKQRQDEVFHVMASVMKASVLFDSDIIQWILLPFLDGCPSKLIFSP